MIVEFGHFALLMALGVALIQMIVPLYGARTADTALMQLAIPASLLQFALIMISFLALAYAYVVSDFTVANVVQNSHSAKPLIYRISGV